MIERIRTYFKKYLLISDEHLRAPEPEVWKMSVLRIISVVGALLTILIVLHSSYIAYKQGLYYVIYITLGFTLILWATLTLSKKRIKLASASLTSTIVGAALCMMFFTVDIAFVRYGLIFFFTLPIILRLLYGNKAAFIGMALNILPFIVLLRNESVEPLFGIQISLPDTHTYLSSLIFLFFNFCMPMGVIRVMGSLERQSQENMKQTKKLGNLVNRYQEIFNNGGTPSFFCDQQGKILVANRSARKLISSGVRAVDYIHELFVISSPLVEGVKQRVTIVGKADSVFEILPASLVHHKKQLIHCFDISSSAAKSRQLDAFKKQHFSKYYFDELTGLKNHHYWKHVEGANSLDGHCCVLLKIGNLRFFNIQFGFEYGDKLLAKVAQMLAYSLPSDVSIYIFPSAKFLLSFRLPKNNNEEIPQWLIKRLPQTIELEKVHTLQWLGGYALADGKKSNAVVVQACSIALGQATENAPLTEFNPESVNMLREHSEHQCKVKFLLDNNHLALFLQPQVNCENAIVSFEVLARLKEADSDNILYPAQFLPVIEENNWSVLFSHKILESAIDMLNNWPEDMPDVPLAINLSGPELLDDPFYEKLLRHYSEDRRLRRRLKLELTETSVLASHLETKRRLASLANLGATIIIDDFGTGHASLSQLLDVPATILKVDREFVDKIEYSERHQKIVRVTMDLAQSLNMEVIAEGVETKTQFNLLRKMGFKVFQGYYFGKPAPLETWVGMHEIRTL